MWASRLDAARLQGSSLSFTRCEFVGRGREMPMEFDSNKRQDRSTLVEFMKGDVVSIHYENCIELND